MDGFGHENDVISFYDEIRGLLLKDVCMHGVLNTKPRTTFINHISKDGREKLSDCSSVS